MLCCVYIYVCVCVCVCVFVCVCVVCIKAMYEGTGDETTLLSR